MTLSLSRNDYVVVLAAGIFVGAALFDAFPEAIAAFGITNAVLWLGAGVALWWGQKVFLQKLEKPDMPVLVTGALWLHSLLEGFVTGLAFGVSHSFGFLIAAAMVLHLLPEFFAALTLLHGSGSSGRTSILTVFFGYAVLFISFAGTYFFLPRIGAALPAAIALSSGAFLYIGIRSYIRRHSFRSFIIFIIGVLIPLFQKIMFG